MATDYTREEMDAAWAALTPEVRQTLLDEVAAIREAHAPSVDRGRDYNDCMKGCADMHHTITQNMAPGGLTAEAAKAIEEMMSECYRGCHEAHDVPHAYDD